MLNFFGTNPALTKENFRRLQWLADNDPKSAGKTVNALLNEIIERYFQEHRLDAYLQAESGFLTQDLQDVELQENLQKS